MAEVFDFHDLNLALDTVESPSYGLDHILQVLQSYNFCIRRSYITDPDFIDLQHEILVSGCGQQGHWTIDHDYFELALANANYILAVQMVNALIPAYVCSYLLIRILNGRAEILLLCNQVFPIKLSFGLLLQMLAYIQLYTSGICNISLASNADSKMYYRRIGYIELDNSNEMYLQLNEQFLKLFSSDVLKRFTTIVDQLNTLNVQQLSELYIIA